MPPKTKRKEDYYSVPSEQLLAFAKAVSPYLESSLKDIGSKTTIEDILKRVALGSEPGGIQMVFSDPEQAPAERRGRAGSYATKWAPFNDYANLYKDKRAFTEEKYGEETTQEEWIENLLITTEESKKESMLADTIRMYLDPTLAGSSKGVDRLLSKPKVMETMYHELMHTPRIDSTKRVGEKLIAESPHGEGQFGPTSQYGYTEAIKKHLGEATSEGKRRAGQFLNKPIYVSPEERGALSGPYKYEYAPDYVRDKVPEKAFYDIIMNYLTQGK